MNEETAKCIVLCVFIVCVFATVCFALWKGER